MSTSSSSTDPPPEARWSVFSAAQNLPAVLNDPNKGKQSNFLTKTWGDGFVERSEIEKSPFLPDINKAHFETYLRKVSKRIRRHHRLKELKPDEANRKRTTSETNIEAETIPDIFLHTTFQLNDLKVFNQVFNHNGHKFNVDDRGLHEKLTQYLDIVEVKIAKQVSQKSGAFFHAMTSHDTIMEQMGNACHEVRQLRVKIKSVDRHLACDSLELMSKAKCRHNQVVLLDKIKFMATVLQTQPTLQLLLSSSDYVAALELIESTQQVLAQELAGVTSLRYLPSQLKEMSRLIDKMLITEFERYAANDLHRPLNANEGVLEPDRLISIVAGLLRQNHLNFLEIYKQEAVTAAQAVLKQLLIEQLADVEDDMEHCLTGSGESTPSLDSSHWLQVLRLASSALTKLVKRVRAVHDVIKQTAHMGAGYMVHHAGVSIQEKKLQEEDLQRVESKLKVLLTSICDYYHERLASLVSTQSDKQNVTAAQIMELSDIVESFSEECDRMCGRQSAALKAAFKIQAGNYVNKFHSQRKNKLSLLLEAERWKVADVPKEFQLLVDKINSSQVIDTIPHSPIENNNKNFNDSLDVDGDKYVTVGTVLILVRLVCEYCVCAHDLPLLAAVIFRNLAELLRTFNSRSCQLVLGAGALKTAGLKTITSTNLALCSRALQLVLWLIPHVRAHFTSICVTESTVSLDTVEKDVVHHIQQLEAKVLSIMTTLMGESLTEWDAKPPVPSKVFRNLSKHLIKLHEAVCTVLPQQQVTDIYEVIHKTFKSKLREQLTRMNIANNGGPQHGVVTSELTFYKETLRNLNVISDKFLADQAMDDIWSK